jgi:folate-dependent phosphoribosylglycinamide formyltransferase PurN
VGSASTWTTITSTGTISGGSISKNSSTEVRFKIMAQDGSTTGYYTLTVYRPASTDVTLSSVTVTEGMTTTALTVSGTTYTYTLGSGTTSITVTSSGKSGENSTVRLLSGGSDSTTVVTDGLIDTSAFAAGTYVYTIEVTPQDSNASKGYYTFNVIKKSSAKELNAALTHTDNSDAVIDMSYNATTYIYSVTIPYSLNEVIVKNVRLVITGSAKSTIATTGFTAGATIENKPSMYINIKFATTDKETYTNSSIIVTAEDGSTVTYSVNIVRSAASADATLTGISINDSSISGFKSSVYTYNTVNIFSGDTESVFVSATANSEFATIAYNGSTSGQIALTRGVTSTVSIVVTAQSGVQQTYIVKVLAANTDNTVQSIVLKDGNGTVIGGFAFDSVTYTYSLTVAYSVNSADIQVTATDSYASITGSGLKAMSSVTTYTYVVYATSESGEKGSTYTINITRSAADTDITLSALTVKNGATNYLSDFSADTHEYTVRVDNTISTVSINATPKGVNAIAAVTPVPSSTTLTNGGTKEFTVTVTAESGDKGYYTVSVIRANDNNTVSQIKIGGNSVTMDSSSIVDCGSVTYATTSIVAEATRADTTATVYYNGSTNGTVSLTVGENIIEIYALSQYGAIIGQTSADVLVYRYKVTRTAASTNNDLESLAVTDGDGKALSFDGSVTFTAANVSYSITLDKTSSVSSVIINASATTDNKSVSGATGTQLLTMKTDGSIDDSFIITVTSESGATKNYTVRILKATAYSSDCSIKSVTLLDGDNVSYLTFDGSTAAQSDVTIPYSVSGLTLTVETNDSTASVGGTTGFIPVTAGGYSGVSFQVTAQDGTKGLTYTFKISRTAANTNKYLSSLTVADATKSGVNLLTGFSSSTYTYKLRVDDDVESVVIAAAVPADNFSKIVSTIASSYDLTSGSSREISIVVQAEDESTQTYSVTVLRANNDNALASIEVNKTSIPVASFTKNGNNYEYTYSPDFIYSVTTVEISATLVDSGCKATVTGTGIQNLASVGTNSFVVYATAQDGTVGNNYVVRINRLAASSDATLKSLSVKNGETAVLDVKSGTVEISYDLNADRTVTSVTVDCAANFSAATVSGDIGSNNLTAGEKNTLKIYVTAEDGTTKKTYTVNVTVKDDDNTIKNITATSAATLNTVTFAGATVSYDLGTVSYPTTEVTFNVTLSNQYAKLYINGTVCDSASGTAVTLAEGSNTVTVYAVSERGTQGTSYEYKVTRTPANTDTKLSALSVTDGSGNALSFSEGSFSGAVYSYTIELDKYSEITKVIINATAEYEAASVSGATGTQNLTLKTDGSIDDSFVIIVTSESKATKNYTVRILKATAYSSDCSIKSVTLVDGNNVSYLTFDGSTAAQSDVTIPYSVSGLTLTVETNDSTASVGGTTGFIPVTAGGYSGVSFQVTAQDGTKGLTYTFKISRTAANTNKYLSILTVADAADSGVNLLTGFSSSTYTYKLRVDDDVESVVIAAAVPADNFSKIVSNIASSYDLTSGSSREISIVVQAEDESTQTYSVTVLRANNDNALASISVNKTSIPVASFTKNGNNYEYTYSPDFIYSVTTVEISATLADSGCKATVTGTGIQNLASVGTNSFVVYATAQDGTVGNNYVLRINRLAASSDATLKSLSVKNGETAVLDVKSGSVEISYDLNADRTVTSVTVDCAANFSAATVSGDIGSNNLTAGEKNTLKIYVTAEDGTTKKTYTVNVTVKDDDNTIKNITATSAAALNTVTFAGATVSYDLGTVPYDTESVVFDITLGNKYAKLYVNGAEYATTTGITVELADNANKVTVYAVSERGTVGTSYVYTVNRTPANTNTNLSALTVTDGKGGALGFNEGSFDSGIHSYTVELADNSSVAEIIISAKAEYSGSVITGDTGTETLTEDNGVINQQFFITVTAESGDTQQYIVNVIKGTKLSGDNSIKSVTLTDTSGKEYLVFDSAKAAQTDVDIPYKTEGLYLAVSLNDATAALSGSSGYIAVAAGESANVSFRVTAQDGTEGLQYTFKISRANANTEKYLETLTVADAADSGVDLLTDFSSETTSYGLRVDDDVASVIITATVPSDNYSQIIGTVEPSYSLTSGASREISIIVQAEDGSTQTYKITILRANNDNAIQSITVDSVIIPIKSFVKNGNNYEYTVTPDYIYSVSTAKISATLVNSDCKAVITGTGTMELVVGANTFLIYATAQDGTVGNNYVVRINRLAASSDATLKSLTLKNGAEELLNITTGTVAEIYNIDADRSVTDITVSAAASHTAAVVSGDIGSNNLTAGEKNTLKIYVTAEDGTTKKTYTVNVTVKDDDNTIKNITATSTATLNTVTFAGATVSYDLGTVPYDTESVVFDITLGNKYAKLYVNGAEYATTTGITVELADNANKVTVYGVSERGTVGTNYVYTVNRTPADTDTTLSSLSVSDGKGNTSGFSEGDFLSSVNEYTVVLPSSSVLSSVVIAATATHSGSVVTGIGTVQLKEVSGIISNRFTVTVTAESGAVGYYYITVVRNSGIEASDDTDISEIHLTGNGVEYMTSFDSAVAVQTPITVPYSVSAVYLTITANEKAKVTGAGLYSVDEGETITITFGVTAESGVAGTVYSVAVSRENADTDNKLSDLYYQVDGTEYELNPDDSVFNINLANTVSAVVIGGTKPDKAVVTGLGTYTLNGKSVTKVVTVTAENGDVRSYVLNFIMQSDDATLKSIKNRRR